MALNHDFTRITARIIERSKPTRETYLAQMRGQKDSGTSRGTLSCGNLAHGFAAAGEDKALLKATHAPNLGIITAYNDMLSAHQPFARYPEQLKIAARQVGATAQVAGGVPAMCDGVTQGQPGMDLSLFSRDVIAMSTAIAASHNMFDGLLLLGVCDKIVPGLLIGALRFGHLPSIFVPAGPMPSGLANKEKVRVRQLYAEGKASREDLLEAESASYHGAGTCTFYGTANSNQMMMEVMGLHVPGTAFVNPGTALRDALTRQAAHSCAAITALGQDYRPMCDTVDARSLINAVVGLLATGGSTNHAIHIPAMARAAGVIIDWQDMHDLSSITPMLARVYPNGSADVNNFHAAGGMGFVIRQLLDAGLLHDDIQTVHGKSLSDYACEPKLQNGELIWTDAPAVSLDETIVCPATNPHSPDGGLRLVQGNLGRAIFKTSAVEASRFAIEAPALVFENQQAMLDAFKRGEMERDCVVVVRFQGPQAAGMPELHKLTPQLGILQDRGFKVALVTDGRMSGASGKVPAAIHVTPEAMCGGALACVQNGDIIRVDAATGTLEILTDISDRTPALFNPASVQYGMGRELFAFMRTSVGSAETGASVMLDKMGQN
jgi:phosphogluconate dehydratase